MKTLVKILPLFLLMAMSCNSEKTVKMEKGAALVVVDELYDFIDGGSLACGHSVEAVEYTQKLIEANPDIPVLFVCDHHPANHSSFVEQGGPWPPHCVAGTRGGEVHDALKPYVVEELTFYKGCDPAVEQYSGFDGRNPADQSLAEVLTILDATSVYVVGIATEYCVYNTANDLKNAGFTVKVIEKGLGYVAEDGHAETLNKMRQEGFTIL